MLNPWRGNGTRVLYKSRRLSHCFIGEDKNHDYYRWNPHYVERSKHELQQVFEKLANLAAIHWHPVANYEQEPLVSNPDNGKA
jgi:hypothetical protein